MSIIGFREKDERKTEETRRVDVLLEIRFVQISPEAGTKFFLFKDQIILLEFSSLVGGR